MSLAESRGAISKAMRDLLNRWETVHGEWNDAQAEMFQQQYLLELETLVRKAVSSMDHMNVIINKTVKDCE